MTDVDSIAAGLSERSREAVLTGWANWATSALLFSLGIIKERGGFTPIGLAVRAKLEADNG